MFKSFLLEIFLSCAILLQLLFNTRLNNKSTLNYLIIDTILYSQVSFIIFVLIVLSTTVLGDFFSFNVCFISNSEIVFIKLIISCLLLLSLKLIISTFSLQNLNFHEFISIFLLSLLASFFILNSKDLISFYLSIEMQSLCFYLLACFKRNSAFSSEAGLKYFIGSSFMSGIFLLGCSILYGALGTLNLANISILTTFTMLPLLSNISLFGILLITFFLLYKTAAVPFHFLYPDVYEGAPLSSTVIFNLLPYFSIYFFFNEWLHSINMFFPTIQILLLFCGILSILVGTFFAISQFRIKRLVIYSSIAQVGFLISALSLNLTGGIVIVYFYLFIYLLTSFLIWGFIFLFLNFKNNICWGTILPPLLVSSFSKVFKLNKIFGFSFVVVFFSLGGIPPFVGFISKILVLQELINNSFYLISVILIIISSISVFYYLRIIKIMFFEPVYLEKNTSIFLFSNAINLQTLYIHFSFSLFLLLFLCFIPEIVLIFFTIIFN